MGKILDFGLFLESKEEKEEKIGAEREVRKIISDMFTVGKNIKFSGDQNGEPEYVEFEVDEKDFKLDYKGEDLCLDYSEGVLKKRKYQVSLTFVSKSKEEGDKPAYKVKFKIKLKPTSEIKTETKEKILGWLFEDKPEKVIKFINKHNKECEWSESTGRLTISKSDFDELPSEYLKALIREFGGEKVRIN